MPATKTRPAPKTKVAAKSRPAHTSRTRPPELTRFSDLFCGIGGFHEAASRQGLECVFACDIDEPARHAYQHNYGLLPHSDIQTLAVHSVPDHDLLFAGFPCQPFSIIGSRQGTQDARGVLYQDIIRIVRAKLPSAIILENVRQLATIQNGQVLADIRSDLERLGYNVQHHILNALDFGLPQKRERIIIVAALFDLRSFEWPAGSTAMSSLADVLEPNPDPKHLVSPRIRRARHAAHKSDISPAIWHENKGGNIASHPFSCALRAGASYNYLLVDGERRLTPREMLRLQGFPDTFEIVCNDSQTRKQAGNAVPVPMIAAVIEQVLKASQAAV